MIFSSVKRRVLIIYLFVLTLRKKTLVASFRQGRSTTTSFAHRNAPFAMKEKMIDRIYSAVLTAARKGGAGSVCKVSFGEFFFILCHIM